MDLPNKEVNKELHDQVSEFWMIAYECRKYYLYCLRLHKPTSKLEGEYLHYSRFFKTTRHVYWRTLVTELAKLYSNRNVDRYNVQKFIRYLASDPLVHKAGIDQSILNDWNANIEEHKNVIQIIMHLRDKYYGHTDTPAQKAEVNHEDLTIQQLEPLITIAENVIKLIHLKVFDADAHCEVAYLERDFDFITTLAELKEQVIRSNFEERMKSVK